MACNRQEPSREDRPEHGRHGPNCDQYGAVVPLVGPFQRAYAQAD